MLEVSNSHTKNLTKKLLAENRGEHARTGLEAQVSSDLVTKGRRLEKAPCFYAVSMCFTILPPCFGGFCSRIAAEVGEHLSNSHVTQS